MPVNGLPPADAPARWSPEYLAAIVDSSDDAIIGKTLDGTIVSWNPGAERLYGYTPDEMIGRPISIIVPAEHPDELPQILDRLRRGERIEHYRTTRVTKDGERITVSVTISPVRDASGTIIGASAIARDVGEHERAIEEALRLREDFISVVAHELRTPLTILYGRLQLVARRLARPDHDAAASRRDMAEAQDAAVRLRDLLERLLNMSRIRSGRLELERAPTDVAELVRRTASSLAEISGREIQVRATGDRGATRANVDELRLEEVVANLLDNAVKYSPASAPVEVEVAGTDHEVRIAVRDHGPGVPPAEREKIFEPFHRGETGLPGVGLGLHVAREIVTLHGGSLSLDGPSDGGTRFVVSVPRDGNGRQEMRGPQAAPRRDA